MDVSQSDIPGHNATLSVPKIVHHHMPEAANASLRKRPQGRRRVLVVEFRDEVYESLESLFREHGFEVERAECGSTVAHKFHQFAPDIVLINDDTPDASGWLIASKLRLSGYRQTIWLYTVRLSRWRVNWKLVTEVDEVIAYGGKFAWLVQRVRQLIAERLSEENHRIQHQGVNTDVAWRVA